jgi:hypothetical protein
MNLVNAVLWTVYGLVRAGQWAPAYTVTGVYCLLCRVVLWVYGMFLSHKQFVDVQRTQEAS